MIGAMAKLIRCRRGTTAMEYGFILCLICIVVIAAIGLLGGRTLTIWTNVSVKIPVVQG